MSYYVYKYYDVSGVLLYVGMTNNLKTRDHQHRKSSDWYTSVSDTIVVLFDTKNDATVAETLSIKTELPLFNKRETCGRVPYKTSTLPKNTMEAKKLILCLGGFQAVANILNEQCVYKNGKPVKHSRQVIFNWYKADKIPAWAQIEYPRVWKKAERMVCKKC